MHLDLNQAEVIKDRHLPIPSGYAVKARFNIRRRLHLHQSNCLSLYMDLDKTYYIKGVFTVMSGCYKNRLIYQDFCIERYNALNDNDFRRDEFWGKAMLRAMVESAKGVAPDDHSEAATKSRQVKLITDLENLTCGILLDVCDEGKLSLPGVLWKNPQKCSF